MFFQVVLITKYTVTVPVHLLGLTNPFGSLQSLFLGGDSFISLLELLLAL